jgi:hypothetical protein
MGLLKGEKMLMKFEYDFDVDGGAIAAIPLRQVAGNALLAGYKVTNAYVIVEDAITSDGTPTVVIGNTADADGYFADTLALMVANGGFMAGEVAGDLIWDDTNDHNIMYSIAAANTLDVNVTVGTAALTAGKFSLFLEILA